MFFKKFIKFYFFKSDEYIKDKKAEIQYDLEKGIIYLKIIQETQNSQSNLIRK